MSNRTVHATLGADEVVRYNRAGKWYVEWGSGRRQLTIREAAETAVAFGDSGGWILINLPGGGSFDRLVKQIDGAS